MCTAQSCSAANKGITDFVFSTFALYCARLQLVHVDACGIHWIIINSHAVELPYTELSLGAGVPLRF